MPTPGLTYVRIAFKALQAVGGIGPKTGKSMNGYTVLPQSQTRDGMNSRRFVSFIFLKESDSQKTPQGPSPREVQGNMSFQRDTTITSAPRDSKLGNSSLRILNTCRQVFSSHESLIHPTGFIKRPSTDRQSKSAKIPPSTYQCFRDLMRSRYSWCFVE